MARAKRRVKRIKRSAVKKIKRSSAKTANGDPVLEELGTIKRLLMLQLVGSGIKPVDIAVILGVDKSVISGLIPVRSLLISKRPERFLDVEPAEVIKRLDTLIAWTRRNSANR